MITAFASIVVAGVGADPEQRPLRRSQRLQPLDHFAEMKVRPERMDLLHQIVDQLLAVDDRIARNVVDRLFRDRAPRIGRPACDRMSTRWHFMSSRPSSNTENSPTGPAPMIATSVEMTSLIDSALLRRRRHDEPVQFSVTLIWQESREFGRTSKAKSSMSSSICEGSPTFSVQSVGDIDMAGRAGAGAAAFRLDAGNRIVQRRLHHGRADLGLDRAGVALRRQ